MIKDELSKNDMITYLKELNDRLASNNEYGEIIITGGASLCLVYDSRQSTRDIDAYFEPSSLRKYIKEIATENNLREDWLNDGAKGFLSPKMKTEPVMEFSNLSVSSIDAKGLLALKLTAARTDLSDANDSIFLMRILKIETEDELFDIIENNTYKQHQTAAAKFFTKEVFQQYQQLHLKPMRSDK